MHLTATKLFPFSDKAKLSTSSFSVQLHLPENDDCCTAINGVRTTISPAYKDEDVRDGEGDAVRQRGCAVGMGTDFVVVMGDVVAFYGFQNQFQKYSISNGVSILWGSDCNRRRNSWA
ncbi:hypothetical protein RHSIM_Rhsim03G0224900 [Rhododendron simsii]|uniref:Uncharacterized protein n=1 Tax=Rhododendron simsii TaxID=118357 RepID=A0A834H6L5_RHOSS|nr:hypothetical protein RHSIM_Rhsim03G0224900 [Rhododendron simsii]